MRRINVGDLKIRQEEEHAILEVLRSGRISEGKKVKKFEDRFAEYIGTKYCVAVNSGTSALVVGLLALQYDERFPKVRKNAKVITSPVTYIATVNALVLSGYEPVFADIDKHTFKLNMDEVATIIENNKDEYAGILPVHLMGYPNDMETIDKLARENDLFVFEDAAQAHGSMYKGKKLGAIGLLSDFSFYIAHNIQVGEMGCVCTNDEPLYKLLKQLKANGRLCSCAICTRNKGICPGFAKYEHKYDFDYDPRFMHEYISYNFKTTEFTAAIGLTQLSQADYIAKKRKENVTYLNKYLSNYQDIFYLPVYSDDVSYLAYPMIIKENSKISRRWIRKKLEENGIETRPLFGCIPTQQPAFNNLKTQYNGKLPMADYVGKNAFYLGCHQYLEEEDLYYIVKVFRHTLD